MVCTLLEMQRDLHTLVYMLATKWFYYIQKDSCNAKLIVVDIFQILYQGIR
jgi:hypothetical protein